MDEKMIDKKIILFLPVFMSSITNAQKEKCDMTKNYIFRCPNIRYSTTIKQRLFDDNKNFFLLNGVRYELLEKISKLPWKEASDSDSNFPLNLEHNDDDTKNYICRYGYISKGGDTFHITIQKNPSSM